jgi:hypothetical protein
VVLRATFAETPELAERRNGSSADRGLDNAETKAPLWEDCRIRPLIDTRALWREEKEAPDYDSTKEPSKINLNTLSYCGVPRGLSR